MIVYIDQHIPCPRDVGAQVEGRLLDIDGQPELSEAGRDAVRRIGGEHIKWLGLGTIYI
jgi:hypothetical protein